MSNSFVSFGDALKDELDAYYRASEPLFSYLQKQSKVGFSSAQFALYRDNYIVRTSNTIPSVCRVLISAHLNQDYIAISSVKQNLFEELGGLTKDSETHFQMLMHSHNEHGKIVFQLPEIEFQDCLRSPSILPEVRDFLVSQNSLYSSARHVEVLAASYAQEEAASEMLTSFMMAFFAPYSCYYEQQRKFENLVKYFTCHLDGLEQRHADDARHCLFEQCRTEVDFAIAVSAVNKLLSAQAAIWIALERGLSAITDENKITPCNV